MIVADGSESNGKKRLLPGSATPARNHGTGGSCTLADRVIRKRISGIKPAPENDEIYGRISVNDPDIACLADDIKRRGQLEPIVITRDRFIVSGHRRYWACRRNKQTTILCRVRPYKRTDNPQQFIDELKHFNDQRVKRFDQVLREQLVDADPDSAHRRLVSHRLAKSIVVADTVELPPATRRYGISDQKRPMLDAAIRVLEDLREFWPLSCRKVHYEILNNPPAYNPVKQPGVRYQNIERHYKNLCALLTRARIAGLVPWAAITDETRPFEQWNVWPDAAPFIADHIDRLFRPYYRDLLQSQPNHVEIVSEKLTVNGIIQSVAGEYCLPITCGRGYAGIDVAHKMARRYHRSRKDKLVVLIASDHDPDGECICSSFATTLRDDFGVRKVEAVRIALTRQQVIDEGLEARWTPAKKTSKRYPQFKKLYGDRAYELEALPARRLQELTRERLAEVLDIEAYNHEVDCEKQDAANIEKARRVAMAALKSADFNVEGAQ